jgi:hypothetical protein
VPDPRLDHEREDALLEHRQLGVGSPIPENLSVPFRANADAIGL